MDNSIAFSFSHQALSADDKVQVLSFSGSEGISRLYEFDIELLSLNPDLDIDKILETQASLTIELGDETRVIQGIISHCDAVSQVNNQTLYKAKLVPKLWELSLYHTNEVYLDKNIKEIIEIVLQEAGFTSQDYDLTGLQGNYRDWSYKCQYDESHLDFISRLMERDGIYYYFTEGEIGEKLVFCDSLQTQEDIKNSDVLYSPAASLEINALADTVTSFVNQKKRLPHKVLLKDYNDDKPSVDIKGEFIVDDSANPTSEIYVWGQNIQTPEEGEQLAQVRAEEISSTKSTYHGESSVIRLLSGHQFSLTGHFRASCNQDYLLLSVNHEAKNPSLLHYADGQDASAVVYQNTFSAIAADVQYRSSQVTAKPEIHGTLNAFVDAEGDGHYAELDEEGRYRVTLPFDRLNRDGGKSSHWIRMSQPYGGEGQGMSFPLRKGTEVLLTFIGGDPDRPVIAGTVPNASQPSITTADNQTNSLIKTGSGNKIELEDQDGKNRIKLQTGDDKTYVHLGAPNHPGDGWVVVTNGIERKEIAGGQQHTVKASLIDPTAITTDTTDSNTQGIVDIIKEQEIFQFCIKHADGTGSHDGDKFLTVTDEEVTAKVAEWVAAYSFLEPYQTSPWLLAFARAVQTGAEQAGLSQAITDSDLSNAPIKTSGTMNRNTELSGNYIISRTVGDTYSVLMGNQYNYGDGNEYDFGNSQVITHWDQDDNDDVATLLSTMQGYEPTGMEQYTGTTKRNPEGTWCEIMAQGEVEIKQTDTFTAQNGNIYDFGGHWDYNFGNGYEESNINQSDVEINRDDLPNDAADVGGPSYSKISKKGKVEYTDTNVFVEKKVGDSYDYKLGNTLEVTAGATESHNHGDKWEYQFGDSYEEIIGNSETHFGKPPVEGAQIGATAGGIHGGLVGAAAGAAAGALIQTLGGNTTKERYYGMKDEMMIGATSSMSLALTNEMFLGLKNDMSLAGTVEVFIGLKNEMNIAHTNTLNLGTAIEADLVVKTEVTAAQIDAKITEIKATASAKIDSAVSNISTIATIIRTGGIEIDMSGLVLM